MNGYLQWDWIDIGNRLLFIPAKSFKQRREHVQPIPDIAMKVILSERGKHPVYVWTVNGEPLNRDSVEHHSRKTLNEVGLRKHRLHDIRRTWSTWLQERGVSKEMVTRIGGWTDERIVADVYTNLSGNYLLSQAEKINEVIEIVTQNDTKRAFRSDKCNIRIYLSMVRILKLFSVS